MKHIRLFENSEETVKEFLNGKIDWKLYNYIIDKFTEFEDVGHLIRYSVSLFNYKQKEYRSIFIYENGVYRYSDSSLLYDSDCYEKFGLYYIMTIINDENMNALSLYTKIKGKCKVISLKKNRLIIKPI